MRVLTERDLNREFFDDRRAQRKEVLVDNKKKKRPNRFLAPLAKPFQRASHCGRSGWTNLAFCYSFLLPQIGKLLRRKWDRFSCRALVKRTFPGVVLLRCALSICSCGKQSARLKEEDDFATAWRVPEDERSNDSVNGSMPEQQQGIMSISTADLDNAAMSPPRSNRDVDVAFELERQIDEDDTMDTSQHQQAVLEEKYPTPELVKSAFLTDIFAGFSVGAMSVPQGMSYALLAGLEYQYGLYNNFIYPFCFFLLGTCRHAVIGVSAVENIMIGTSITSVLPRDATLADRHNVGVALCLASAIVYMIFRVCKLAVLADLLADPVLSGFATASAFLVGTSQLKYVFGLSVIESDWRLPRVWIYILSHLHLASWAPVICCICSLVFLFVCKRVSRMWCGKFVLPGPLMLVIVSCLISWGFDLSGNYGLRIVGHIPQGLPALSWPHVSWLHGSEHPSSPSFAKIMFQALILCPMFFVIHMSIAKTIAMRQNYSIDIAQELVAFSGCNLVGTFFSNYPATTSLSRSSVTESLGARTSFHNLAAGSVVLCTILFLTKPLGYLPMASLAAVVLFGVSKMAEFEKVAELWRLQVANWAATDSIGGGVNSPDLLLWLVSFFATAIIGATEGILISVALSLIWIGKGIVRPEFIQLGRLQDTEIYRNQQRFPQATQEPGIALYRIDAPLNFCNAGFLERNVKAAVVQHFESEEQRRARVGHRRPALQARCYGGRQTTSSDSLIDANLTPQRVDTVAPPCSPPYFFILDCSSVNGLDVTAISAFGRIAAFAAQYDCSLLFANWKGPQRDYLHRANFYKIVPPQRCFLSNHDAVVWAKAVRHKALRFVINSTSSAGTVTPTSPSPPPAVDEYGATSPHSTIEWDGLSALVPNVRYVRERAQDGQDREWPLSVVPEKEP